MPWKGVLPSGKTKGEPKRDQTSSSPRANDDNVTDAAVTVGPDDVLMGRGAPITDNPGNARLRQIVVQRIPVYVQAKSQQDRHQVAQQILQEIRQRGGRFLRKVKQLDDNNKDGGQGIPTFVVVNNEKEIVTKIKQLLRDMEPESMSRRLERRRYSYRKLGQKTRQSSKRQSQESAMSTQVDTPDGLSADPKVEPSTHSSLADAAHASSTIDGSTQQTRILPQYATFGASTGVNAMQQLPGTAAALDFTVLSNPILADGQRSLLHARQLGQFDSDTPPLRLPISALNQQQPSPWLLQNLLRSRRSMQQQQQQQQQLSQIPILGMSSYDPLMTVNPWLAAVAAAASAGLPTIANVPYPTIPTMSRHYSNPFLVGMGQMNLGIPYQPPTFPSQTESAISLQRALEELQSLARRQQQQQQQQQLQPPPMEEVPDIAREHPVEQSSITMASSETPSENDRASMTASPFNNTVIAQEISPSKPPPPPRSDPSTGNK